jgi:hypothetical protein
MRIPAVKPIQPGRVGSKEPSGPKSEAQDDEYPFEPFTFGSATFCIITIRKEIKS